MARLIQLTEDQLREVQDKSLEIALYVVDFCKRHGLRVYFYAGSLLGAIREHGFIPWDDDIDLIMPAPDFRRLRELWDIEADTERYSLCVQTKQYNDHTLSGSVRDNNTTFVTDSTMNSDVNQGLAVDIEPIHAAPQGRVARELQLICAVGASLFKAGRVPARQSKPVKKAAQAILGIFRSEDVRYAIWNTLESLASRADRHWEDSECVREFTMFPFITWLFPREWFDKAVYVPFEGVEVPVPVGYDGYLRKRYGDYMTPPPESDRRPEHRIVFLDLDTPYINYRGIKYFVGKEGNEQKGS